MTMIRTITGASAALALAGAAAAGGAPAPVLGPQRTWKGATAPLSIVGTGLHKGQKIPHGDRLVYRDVTLDGRQVVNFAIRAPAGTKIRGVTPTEQDARPTIQFVVNNVRPKGAPVSDRYYPGGTRVTLRAREYPADGGAVTGRIYALVG